VDLRGRYLLRWSLRIVAFFLLCLVGLAALVYFRQHSMIYHPRPYDASYARSLPPSGVEIEYSLLGAKQTAYYIPGRDPVPQRLWIAFCGNGSLALDWTTALRGYPRNGDAFLLVDYPGYGKNSGYATIDGMRASTEAAVSKVCERLHLAEEQLPLAVLGHSLGAAVALDFAAHHRVERIVLIAPFTTLREEAAGVVGGPLSHLLIENYDNRKNLAGASRRNPGLGVAIFHGTNDDVIPVAMGRELARKFPFAQFFPIEGAGHVSVLTLARDQIIDWIPR
jgi:pimeloyl-ACP methyl ester carboxylesterase